MLWLLHVTWPGLWYDDHASIPIQWLHVDFFPVTATTLHSPCHCLFLCNYDLVVSLAEACALQCWNLILISPRSCEDCCWSIEMVGGAVCFLWQMVLWFRLLESVLQMRKPWTSTCGMSWMRPLEGSWLDSVHAWSAINAPLTVKSYTWGTTSQLGLSFHCDFNSIRCDLAVSSLWPAVFHS